MQTVDEAVCRPSIRRYWAGTRPVHTVASVSRGLRDGQREATDALNTRSAREVSEGGRRGGNPPHMGGPKARPPKKSRRE